MTSAPVRVFTFTPQRERERAGRGPAVGVSEWSGDWGEWLAGHSPWVEEDLFVVTGEGKALRC